MLKRSETFYQSLNKRRSIRQISSRPVPVNIIKNVIRTAGTSPSGAYSEPWVFVVIKDPGVKSKIRDIIEQEEYLNYNHRMGEKWVNDLKFVNMNHEKPYLEEASYLINLFKSQYHVNEPEVEQPRVYNPLLLLLYYVSIHLNAQIAILKDLSVSYCFRVLLTIKKSLHFCSIWKEKCSVTTTPLNAGGQIRELLGQLSNEKVMLVLPVGYPSEVATVPDVKRKEFDINLNC
ncbi:PREDICTED: iodotyrosine deiodinase 1-like, partial [Amphimedon queenslandica]|uniref:Nitroreductase domain-containing protein n=1 Tax=Amphimedon queenslandica TaxID=400682 RepID=A0AAN0JTT3_AMPQE